MKDGAGMRWSHRWRRTGVTPGRRSVLRRGGQGRGIVADYLLAIDQGTTSTRSILFDAALTPIAAAQQELRQIYPAPGWGEHDPDEIWSATLATARAALAEAGAGARDIAGIGITNQRETTI